MSAIEKILGDKSYIKNVTFYHKLLALDERKSKMDIQYWLDYVQLFGVKELIPIYDKMNPIMYRNWDVYVTLWILLGAIGYI